MATTVDTLLVEIEADLSGLRKQLSAMDADIKRATTGSAAAFNKMGTAIKAIAGAVIVQQIGRIGAAAVMAAADVEEMQAKSTVVFGAFRDDAVNALEEFGRNVGRSRFQLEGMASTLQDTFVPLGFMREEAAKLSVEMTKLAVDVASFNNASDTETLAAFQSALVGNHETVRRFGIIITQATLDQELMRMGIEKGTKAATEQQKVMARMNLILNGVTDAQGDAARTADSFANQLKAAQANTEELSVAIGVALMPAATAILETFNELTTSILNAGIAMGIFAATPEKKLGIVKDELSEITKTLNVLDAMAGATDVSGKRAEMIGFIANNYGDREGAEARVEELRQQKKALEDEIAAIKATSEAAKEAARNIESGQSGTTGTTGTTGLSEKDKELKKLAEKSALLAVQNGVQLTLNKAIETGNREAEKTARQDLILLDLKKKYPELAKTNIELLQNEASARAEAAMRTNDQKTAFDAAKEALDNYNASVEDGLSLYDQMTNSSTDLEEKIADLKAAFERHGDDMPEYEEVMAKLRKEVLKLDPAYKQAADRADQAFNQMADAITDMVMRGKFDLQSLGNLFKQTIREMIADAIKAQIIKPILGSIFGAIGGAIPGPIGTFIGGIGKAGGGDIDRPTLVGERGPELFVPHSAGTILNSHNTKNALGGGPATIVNQTINVETGVSQTVRAEMLSLLPRFKQDTMAAVVDAKRRGGSYGSAFG